LCKRERRAQHVANRAELSAHAPSSLDERIASALTADELRAKCRVRAATLYERLTALTTTGRIVKVGNGGYRLVGWAYDNQDETPLTSSFRFPHALQRVGRELGSSPSSPIFANSLVRLRRSHSLAPAARYERRRAQRRSMMARQRQPSGLVIDRREHAGILVRTLGRGKASATHRLPQAQTHPTLRTC
jgi:hypothetical protein